jgi:hypothetical protein
MLPSADNSPPEETGFWQPGGQSIGFGDKRPVVSFFKGARRGGAQVPDAKPSIPADLPVEFCPP